VFAATTLTNFKATMKRLMPPELQSPMSSAPNLRIFVKGSFRAWGRDDVPTGFHFIVVVARSKSATAYPPTIDLEIPHQPKVESTRASSRVVKIELIPGRVIIHSTALQYKLSSDNSSADPREGLIIVDGYIW